MFKKFILVQGRQHKHLKWNSDVERTNIDLKVKLSIEKVNIVSITLGVDF